MQKDILLEFYLASTKLQFHESRLCDPCLSEDNCVSLLRDIEQSRRDLGAVLVHLLNSAIPSYWRLPRLFRTKYTEEIDFRNLEKCLVAAANKVISFDPSAAPRDVDLRPAQPSATNFLDLLSRVQSMVLAEIDVALSTADKVLFSKTEHAGQFGGPLINNPEDSNSEDGSTKSRAAHALRYGSVSKSSDSVPVLCAEGSGERSTSLPKQVTQPHFEGDMCTTVFVKVKVGSRIYNEPVRLPPPAFLCISSDLRRCLVELDDAAANFEFDFVKSFTRKMRTPRQANDLQIVTVLFSETLMWSLSVRLLTMQQLADRDPSVILCLPRLVVLVGTKMLPDSPIGANRLAFGRRLPYMFAAFRSHLAYLARQLNALRLDQLCRLALWLGPRGLPDLIPQLSSKQVHSNPVSSTSSTHVRSTTPDHNVSRQAKLMGDHPSRPIPPCVPLTDKSAQPWRTNLAGLHRIFKRISSVADELSTMFPTELRFILQACIEMHDTSNYDTALAVMEGRELPDDTPSSDQDSETDVELEIPVTINPSERQFTSLAHLFDWTEAVGNQNSNQKLSQALRRCYGYQANLSLISRSPSLSSFGCTQSTKETMHAASFPLEFGFDVITWLNYSDMCSPQHASSPECCDPSTAVSTVHPVSHPRTFGIFSSDKLNLGVSVEGEHSMNDRCIVNHLPPWQPDNVSRNLPDRDWDSGDSDTSIGDALESGDEDSDDEQQSNPYVVGRQCAHCLQSFYIFRRRHHCRRCGHIFCGTCCNHWQPVDGLATTKPVRVCVECHEFLDPLF